MTPGTVWSEDMRTQGSISRSGVLIIQTDIEIVCHHGAGFKVSNWRNVCAPTGNWLRKKIYGHTLYLLWLYGCIFWPTTALSIKMMEPHCFGLKSQVNKTIHLQIKLMFLISHVDCIKCNMDTRCSLLFRIIVLTGLV